MLAPETAATVMELAAEAGRLGDAARNRLGLGGVLPAEDVAANPVAFYVPAFDQIVGGASNLMVVFLIAALLLSMNTATADGSRALYGIARDDMTIKELHHLNRYHVPGRAMTVDMIVNLGLLFFVANTLAILVAMGAWWQR